MNYNDITKNINEGWLPFFEENKNELVNILETVYKNPDDTIYPKQKNIFKTLFYFPPSDTKLVIFGQDPYIGEEDMVPQAHGLAFSVPKSHKKIPPSLKNIFKEIKNCYPEYNLPTHGSLKRWVKKEKIILLNCALSVIKGKSNSMICIWEQFTDKLIKYISDTNEGTIFLLMGNFAINKTLHGKLQSNSLIDKNKHKIFTTKHPSPLSAYAGFFGCNVFKNINDYLEENNIDMIKW
jgi:uracil-DNA glycosylase